MLWCLVMAMENLRDSQIDAGSVVIITRIVGGDLTIPAADHVRLRTVASIVFSSVCIPVKLLVRVDYLVCQSQF